MTRMQAEGRDPPCHREVLELTAVICIETSHYVSFVKTGMGKACPWLFFDSMADRVGAASGYNIPEVRDCTNDMRWLEQEYRKKILETDEKSLPPLVRRLLCDAYICIYQHPSGIMY